MTIRITAKRDGFRRCGVAHSETPTTYPADYFNKEQLATLKADPYLIVEDLTELKKAASAELGEQLAEEKATLQADFDKRLADETARIQAEFDKRLADEKATLQAGFDKRLDAEKTKLEKAAAKAK
jgi:hypothetical protein